MTRDDLTDREITMLEMLANGQDGPAIAARLGHTHGTVRVYLHNLYKKLDVRNKTEAAVWWVKHGNA